MAYVRTVKTASGAIAVQVVYSSRSIEHLGSAHDDQELAALKAAARQRLAVGQGELDLGLPSGTSPGGPLEIASSRMEHLLDALGHVRSPVQLTVPRLQHLDQHALGSGQHTEISIIRRRDDHSRPSSPAASRPAARPRIRSANLTSTARHPPPAVRRAGTSAVKPASA